MDEPKRRGGDETTTPADDAMPESEIDENLAETFPASDPPSWTLGTDHGRRPGTGDRGAGSSPSEEERG